MSAPSPRRLPLASVVVVEAGLAVALVLAAGGRPLVPVGGIVLAAALLVALLRRRDRWLVEWVSLALRYRFRTRARIAEPAGGTPGDEAGDAGLRLLRLVAGDVAVATRHDHDGRAVGLLGQGGAWTAVLVPDTAGVPLVTGTLERSALPWTALACALHDRGVVLDAVTAVWHRPPRPPDANPALEASGELVDPLAGAGTLRMCLVVRLDPTRCPDAIAERGGGGPGTRRALLGALARIRRVLSDHGITTRPLDADEVVDTAIGTGLHGLGAAPTATERWDAVLTAGDDAETGHTVFEVRPDVPDTPGTDPLAAVWSAPGAATTLAVAVGPGPDGPAGPETPDRPVALRCLVRLSAPTPQRLADAGLDLAAVAARTGLGVRRLDGAHAAALVATLPVPSPPEVRTRRGAPVAPAHAPFSDARSDLLADLGPPPAPAALVLGADPDGPVMLTLLRPEPTRVVVLGGLSLGREVVLRAVGSGAALHVDSERPAAWDPVLAAQDSCPDPGLTDPGAVGAGAAGPGLHVHDHGLAPRGPSAPLGPWRTTVVVLPALTPAVTDLADDADLVLLTRMPPHEAELAGRLWRLAPGMVEELRTLPDHGVVALGPQLWRRADRVSVRREAAILGPVRLGD